MTNWRIKHRLLALALLPSMVVAMVLTGYWTAIKIMELNRQLEERGETIVAFLAPAAEYGVLSGNRAYLRSASTRVREEQDLISIRVSDDRDNLLYTHVRDIQDSRRLHTLSALLFGHEVRQFEAPIVLTSLDGFDFLGGSAEVDRRNTERVIGHVRISLSTVPTAVTQTEWLLRSLVIIVVLLALTGLVIYRLEQPISAPLEQMAETVRRIGRGNLEARTGVRTGGELAQLAHGIDNMAENIQRAHARLAERIQSATRDLQDQLDLIDQKNRELTLARGKAEEANQRKSQLLASISHELRTPLSAIQGYAELLEQYGDLDDRDLGWLEIINTSSKDTLKLVNDLLDVARLESGRITIHRSQFQLGKCLSEVIGICRRSLRDRQVDVTLIMSPETPASITSDHLRFKQVITNLLSNALKFTANGQVNVHASVRQEGRTRQLEICVRDFGPGIEPDDLPHIFEPFFQSRHPEVRRHSGAGLGLNITRGITELLGGQILVDSAPGTGSLFTLLLPLYDSDVPLPSPPLPGDLGQVTVWCDDTEVRTALLQTLRVMNLGTRAGRSLDDYIQQLDLNPQGIGIIWVRSLSGDDLEKLRLHPSLLARTLIARNSLMPEETQAGLLAQGARFMPLTLSVQSLNQAIQRRLRPGTASRDVEEDLAEDTIPLNGLRFLVADDNAVNRRLLAEIIQQQGAQVRQVEDGASAVSAYHEDTPDVVLMDVHMPVKDGIEAMLEIRTEDPTARIVAVTADARPEMHISLLQQGFDQVLSKPISEQDLVECVQESHKGVRRSSRRNVDPARDMPHPVHDPVLSLQRAGGNPQLARDMLDMLIRDAQKALEQITETSMGNEALLELVHRIHGGSRYCGTPRLNTRSQALEAALKDGRTDDVPTLLEAWKQELKALTEGGDSLLESLGSPKT
ncbi:multi-sensor hybrid histidine kinase [Thioalkalivibrio sulfidiphilus HL-EbGr7]|uniref:histidine kinase n=1 Tax=Thioalkalivibrio sulfidiphilus (strain HL-EbGR7) TaxID=396588 RepID=B8GPL6_THISH|nr:ATP-binding protein [Thioalkalivibrio sulfidiphilus]ACL72183.1 multi-sensor hybrid histidine kinase [Thioalkalivibrio sulfidiphilus HL-EbGr7]